MNIQPLSCERLRPVDAQDARLPLTAPSWVMPGSAADNAFFLQERVSAMMLCCFERAPRLPAALPDTAGTLCVHVHLPVDLPWSEGGGAAAQDACRIMGEAAHLLGPDSCAILHTPPDDDSQRLVAFVHSWQDAGWQACHLRLENTQGDTPARLKKLLAAVPLALCFDVAHAIVTGWTEDAWQSFASDLADQVKMTHWSAPLNGRDVHAPLDRLTQDFLPRYKKLASLLRGEDVIEVFDWTGVLASWQVLCAWRKKHDGCAKP